MQVHERRLPRTLGKPVGHPQGARLLERQDVPEILGEVLQERQLRRARVAEDGRHPKVPQKVVRNLAHRRHISLPLSEPLAPARNIPKSSVHALVSSG